MEPTMENNLKRPDQRKVYVVDDDDAVRDSLRALLEASGFDVRDYDSAEDFLSHHCTQAKACLLVDVHMPVMSGIELLEHMRSHGPQLPTIMFTGRSDPMLKERALRGGALELLDKPVAEESLLKAIGRAFASADCAT
jgi:two-component system, LuxR family, response regulator FixJ